MENYQGCHDNQTVEQKAKNFKLEEVAGDIQVVDWKEKSSWVEYPVRDQNGSLTCVAQTLATEMGIIFKQKYGEFLDFSASFTYQQRGGTYGGCSSSDIYSRFPKLGNIFESLMPSQKMHEVEVLAVPRKNWYSDIAKPFTVKRIELPVDFETVASTIQATGKGVMVWFHIGANEWTSQPVRLTDVLSSNHSVTAVDFGLVNGKKFIRIKDSVLGNSFPGGYRLISEEYFKSNCYLASYLKTFQTLNVVDDITVVKPKFDGSIISLQKCLKWEGLFPANIAEVESYGNITRTAVIAFQKRYGITPATGVFGPITSAKLKELYS